MKRSLFALALFVCAAAAQAQRLDPNAALRSYAARVLPACPGGTLSLEPAGEGPANFNGFIATVRSTDKYCGAQKYVLYAPKSQQVFVGSVIPLPVDSRPANVRIAQHSSQLLGFPVTATISPFPLPDGVKSVDIIRQTEFGPFSYRGFVDSSEKYLIVGFRGLLNSDPAKAMKEALGAATAARRGSAAAKAEIVEVSDFQCPTCAHAHEKLEPIISKNLSKVNYIRIDLPLFENHKWALSAALGARAIQKTAPAKYWEYVDYVFRNQESIEKRSFDQVLREYCEDHDIDWKSVEKTYSSKAERAALLDQVSKAFAYGINSTPTFFVNGQMMGFGPEGSFAIGAITKAMGLPAPAAAPKAPAR
jgi:protein-disulfide isomerase